MLKIRLQRVGKKNDPSFRVVVTEHQRGPKSGNYLENLGTYNPHTDSTTLKEERIKHWMSVGAQASGTVHNILVEKKIIEGKKKNVLSKKSPVVKEEKEEKPKDEESTQEEVAEETPSKEEDSDEKAPEEVSEEKPTEEEAPAEEK